MAEVKLLDSEIDALRLVLRSLSVRDRTGEIGIMHGADRFVSTKVCLKKADRQALNRAAQKLGLSKGVSVHRK